MTKTYTGFEALERMKTHWIQKEKLAFNKYRFEDGVIKAKSLSGDHYIETNININLFFNNTFVDYVEPIAVGDTVKVKLLTGELFGEVGQVFDEWGKTWFRFKGNKAPYSVDVAVRIEKDELAALKRKATFENAGRMVDEFHRGDIVKFKVAGYEYKAEVMQQGLGKDKLVEFKNCYSGIVPARDITPIKFATYVDATAPDYVKVDPVAPCTAPPMPGMGQPVMNNKEIF
ncbi:hypothetical protein [Bacillus phage vB_BtM_BMBsp2]|nr:hypothetical protein [Bacillus phage vB_BtM_BMBsp2]